MKPMGVFFLNPLLLTTRPLRQKSFLGAFFKQFQEAESVERTMEVPIGLRLRLTKIQGLVSLGIPNMFHLGKRNTIMQTALVRDYVSFLRGIS